MAAAELHESELTRGGALFRAVNERIRELQNGSLAEPCDFVCECADERCFARLPMRADEFDALCTSAGAYAVVPGHQQASLEAVLQESIRYMVVSRVATSLPLVSEDEVTATGGREE